MSYSEDDLVPISALQHFAFCPRQCALIHLEGVWRENRLTVEGRQLHDHVHGRGSETRYDVRIERGLAIRSLEYGLTGITDVVEFRRLDHGPWVPFPVEYKRGRPKAGDCDEVQLCAQALCLEEIYETSIPAGYIFYGKTRRRLEVEIDKSLRRRTVEIAEMVHAMVAASETPPAINDERCKNCSLRENCVPSLSGRSITKYINVLCTDGERR